MQIVSKNKNVTSLAGKNLELELVREIYVVV